MYSVTKDFFYVYEHWLDNEIIYVGKGKGDRAQNFSRNIYWNEVVGGRHKDVKIVIKGYFKEEKDALNFEEMTILELIENGKDLTNITHNRLKTPNYMSRKKHFKIKAIERKVNCGIIDQYNLLDKKNFDNKFRVNSNRDLVSRLSRLYKPGCKTIIFSNNKSRKLKLDLEKSGHNVLELVHSEANMRRLLASEVEDYKLILDTGMIPDKYDVLITNDLGLGRSKLLDESINTVIINFTSEGSNIGIVENPFLRKVENLVYKTDSSDFENFIDFPVELIGVPLTVEIRDKFTEDLKLKNSRGRPLKWPSIVKILDKQGFKITNKSIYIDEKRNKAVVVEYRADSSDFEHLVEFPVKLIGVPMTLEKRKQLAESYNLTNHKGRPLKWPSIAKILENQGFKITNKVMVFDGKQYRVSIVNYSV